MLKLDFEAQGRGSTFTLCHGHLKKGILSHKRATVRFHLNTAVHMSRGTVISVLKITVSYQEFLKQGT